MNNIFKNNKSGQNSYRNFFAVILAKVENSQLWKRFIESCENMAVRALPNIQKIDGIPLWKINRKLNLLADRGISNDDLKKGKIIISLPPKMPAQNTTPVKKTLIEKAINELEGFENLKLSQFYRYKSAYKEKKTSTELSRWIEINIQEL